MACRMILKQDGGYLVDAGEVRRFVKDGTPEEIIRQVLEFNYDEGYQQGYDEGFQEGKDSLD